MIAEPNKKYQIVYADPPWKYNDRMKMRGIHGAIRGAESFYPTMTVDKIKTLPIQNLADDNAVLFLWIVMPLMQEGLDTIRAWGFSYKTCAFSWIKTTRKHKIHFGMGHYTRGNNELCLLGMRGKLPILNHSISQVVISEIGRHSKKPDVVRERIVNLLGDLPRIELFARERVDGWDAWGNEVEPSIVLAPMVTT